MLRALSCEARSSTPLQGIPLTLFSRQRNRGKVDFSKVIQQYLYCYFLLLIWSASEGKKKKGSVAEVEDCYFAFIHIMEKNRSTVL